MIGWKVKLSRDLESFSICHSWQNNAKIIITIYYHKRCDIYINSITTQIHGLIIWQLCYIALNLIFSTFYPTHFYMIAETVSLCIVTQDTISSIKYFFNCIFKNWSVVDLQCCANLHSIAKWLSYIDIFKKIFFSIMACHRILNIISCDMGLITRLGRSLEKEMATHSSILAWRVPWTEEPSGL